MPQWSIGQSFIKFGLNLRKLLRGGEVESASSPPPPFDWETSKKLGLDRVKVSKFLTILETHNITSAWGWCTLVSRAKLDCPIKKWTSGQQCWQACLPRAKILKMSTFRAARSNFQMHWKCLLFVLHPPPTKRWVICFVLLKFSSTSAPPPPHTHTVTHTLWLFPNSWFTCRAEAAPQSATSMDYSYSAHWNIKSPCPCNYLRSLLTCRTSPDKKRHQWD